MIASSSLPQPVIACALAIFQRLAEAEGRIHGISPDDVEFHEVGAVDSIVDIVGTAIGLHYLGIDTVVVSPLPVSRGMVQCQHGLLPLPAPATLELLRGAPVYDSGRSVELITPTGAAIVSSLAQSFGGMPTMTIECIGYGLGARRGAPTPNALRAVLGETTVSSRRSTFAPERAVVVEANIDDMNPQFYEPLVDRLLELGALDVALMPTYMKKGRPAILVQVVCDEARRDAVLETLLAESTSIGARYYEVERACLERRIVTVPTAFGEMRVKVSTRQGRIWNMMPEFEDCRRVAAERRIPLKQVHQEVIRCALEHGLGPDGAIAPAS